jgi:hypothetical protein
MSGLEIITGNGRPISRIVPLPEVRNHISGTALTVSFFVFGLGRMFSHERKDWPYGLRSAKLCRPNTFYLLYFTIMYVTQNTTFGCQRISNYGDPKNNRAGTRRVQFWYGTLTTTVPELAEPDTGNETTRIESSSGTGPSEGPCRKWRSPVLEMVPRK